MATRWKITFETVKGSTAVVTIGDAGYSDSPIVLTPAANAFSITRSQSDAMAPVMSETGYLRVISTGSASEHVEDIHPSGALDRPVSLSIGGQTVWRGYVSTESYSADYQPAPYEVELPLTGLLDTLRSVSIADTGVGLSTIAGLIRECLDATQMSWSDVIVPRQMLLIGAMGDVPEFRMQLSRYNFLHLNDTGNMDDEDWTEFVGDSYYDVLSSICRYFGWTASTQGTALVLSSPRTDVTAFRQVAYSLLDSFTDPYEITTTVLSRATFGSLAYDGTAHRRSIVSGKRKITVRTSLNAGEDVFPKLLFNGETVSQRTDEYECDIEVEDFTYSKHLTSVSRVLNKDREHVSLKKYYVADPDSSVIDLGYRYPDSDILSTWKNVGADIVRSFTYDTDDPPANYSYVSALRLFCDTSSTYNEHFTSDRYWLARITSRGVGSFPAGGALCVNAAVQNSFCWSDYFRVMGWYRDKDGMTQWGPFLNNLRVSLKVGDYYYNGTTWTTAFAIFNISAGAGKLPSSFISSADLSGNSVGRISNTMTLELPYDDAGGCIIPVDRYLEGKMELTFYPWVINHSDEQGRRNQTYAAIYISNLDVRYVGPEHRPDEIDGLRLSGLTGKSWPEDLEISLGLTSDNLNRAGHALLWHDGTPIGQVDLSYPGDRTLRQPEQWLLETAVKLYGSNSTVLELEVEYDPALKIWDFVAVGDCDYIITGTQTDYADEHTILTLLRYE